MAAIRKQSILTVLHQVSTDIQNAANKLFAELNGKEIRHGDYFSISEKTGKVVYFDSDYAVAWAAARLSVAHADDMKRFNPTVLVNVTVRYSATNESLTFRFDANAVVPYRSEDQSTSRAFNYGNLFCLQAGCHNYQESDLPIDSERIISLMDKCARAVVSMEFMRPTAMEWLNMYNHALKNAAMKSSYSWVRINPEPTAGLLTPEDFVTFVTNNPNKHLHAKLGSNLNTTLLFAKFLSAQVLDINPNTLPDEEFKG